MAKNKPTEEIEYDGLTLRVIRSDRRTLCLEVQPDSSLLVRAPKSMSIQRIENFVCSKRNAVDKHIEKLKSLDCKSNEYKRLNKDEISMLCKNGRAFLSERVRYLSSVTELTYGKINVGLKKSIWGSCSVKGNLNFNCLLMLCPDEIIDYIILHELCHTAEMNHSKRFWDLLARFCPDYKERRLWLKTNGSKIIYAQF